MPDPTPDATPRPRPLTQVPIDLCGDVTGLRGTISPGLCGDCDEIPLALRQQYPNIGEWVQEPTA